MPVCDDSLPKSTRPMSSGFLAATAATGEKIPKQQDNDHEWKQQQRDVPIGPQGRIVHVMALLRICQSKAHSEEGSAGTELKILGQRPDDERDAVGRSLFQPNMITAAVSSLTQSRWHPRDRCEIYASPFRHQPIGSSKSAAFSCKEDVNRPDEIRTKSGASAPVVQTLIARLV